MISLLVCAIFAAPLGPLPEHDLVYDSLATRWDEALPLGNGLLGALVWGDKDKIIISLDRTDLWDLRPVPEFHGEDYDWQTMQEWEAAGRYDELIKLYEAPYNRPAPTKIPAGRIVLTGPDWPKVKEARLSLKTATVTIDFEDGSRVEVLVFAPTPVGVIRVTGPLQVEAQLVAPAFGGMEEGEAKPAISAGDLRQLGYPPAEFDNNEYRQSFLQDGWGGSQFAAAMVRQKEEDTGATRIVWSIGTGTNWPDLLVQTQATANTTVFYPLEWLHGNHEAWWSTYWNQSSIDIPNDIIEAQYYRDMYKFGAASRRGHPPITLQGPWTADDGTLPPWKGDYHHDLNTQLSYWPCYTGNRLEEGLAYLDWLWDTREASRDWTQRFFKMPGLNVPMTADLEGKQIGGWRQYTHSTTTAAWLAHHFWLHWKYSADAEFLKDRGYPYLHEVAVFLEAATAEKDAQGKRTLPLSSSPEIHDNRPQAWFKTITNCDLALIRWLFGATAEMAEALGETQDAAHWRDVLAEMPDFALGEDGKLLVAKGEALEASHRHFSHLMAIHPLGLIDIYDDTETVSTSRTEGAASSSPPAKGVPESSRAGDVAPQTFTSKQIIDATLADLERLGTSQWCGYSFAWLGNLAARAGRGAQAEQALETFASAFVLRNSFHCNGDQSGKGYSNFTYRPFTLEGNFAFAAGVHEMLLQSHRGYIEIFPAIPDEWEDVSFERLRAMGGYLVSAVMKEGQVQEIRIKARVPGTARVKSPWTGTLIELALAAGGEQRLSPSDQSDQSDPSDRSAAAP
ncbi:MAG: glycoside hydrolase N-terminal domain-containing protein [Candidatus Hydrogenedentes bacterium]|nr:glycoside hydrolase N-terminal domain-containing protein [Candidatus Hydrogenedentota bacterium]